MATKPTPGGSDGTYGTELNAFLDESLATDGKIKTEALQTDATAPIADAAISNKKYVDDQIVVKTGGDTVTLLDSEGNAMLKDHAYLAQTSGFVSSWVIAGTIRVLNGYVGATTDPVGAGTNVGKSDINVTGGIPSIMFFVPSGAYFEIVITTDTPTITWTSLVTGGNAPIDQD